jgi:L-lactate dehydrogenase complex protein LldG
MSEREKIFARIRDALTVASPKPGSHDPSHHYTPVMPEALAKARTAATAAKEWLPPVGVSSADWVTLFSKNSFDLKADVIIAADAEAAHTQLRRIAGEEGWKYVATHGTGIASYATESLGLPVLSTDGGYDVHEMEKCDVGISECDALIAQTGSVMLTTRSGGGRALSVLPPHHVVIARMEQLVPDLPAAYELLHHTYGPNNWPSMITLITGPSRTGDIERILVLGAHGPKKLTVIIY